MRIRILKNFSAAGKNYHAGEIVNIRPGKAKEWLESGRAMSDKSLDGAKETKIK